MEAGQPQEPAGGCREEQLGWDGPGARPLPSTGGHWWSQEGQAPVRGLLQPGPPRRGWQRMAKCPAALPQTGTWAAHPGLLQRAEGVLPTEVRHRAAWP